MFWPLQSSFKFSRVPKDSKFPLLGVWVSSSHLAQSGVATWSIASFPNCPYTSTFESWIFIFFFIALRSDPWCSNCYRYSLATLLFIFCWSTSNSCSSSLAILICPPCSNWYAKTYVFDLKLSTTPMLFYLCWFHPYAFKMLMKDFKLFHNLEALTCWKSFACEFER